VTKLAFIFRSRTCELARSTLRLFVLGVAVCPGCVLQALDLNQSNSPDTPPSCGANERIDPSTGLCAPCIVRTPPASEECLCQVAFFARPFPYCEGGEADYECLACTGDKTACNAYDGETQTVSDCYRFELCCEDLAVAAAADPISSTPCCPSGKLPYCVPSTTSGQLQYECCACQGGLCPTGTECDPSWQHCDTNQNPARCAPACKPTGPGAQYCCVDCGCQCRPQGA
jgi:hypothetical protein